MPNRWLFSWIKVPFRLILIQYTALLFISFEGIVATWMENGSQLGQLSEYKLLGQALCATGRCVSFPFCVGVARGNEEVALKSFVEISDPQLLHL